MYNKLQYISQGATASEQLNNIQQALTAGCQWIQLRFKNASSDELLPLAAAVKKLCTDHGAIFIVNDHPHIAKEIDADGVHLGLNDMKVESARKILGAKIIGGTANTLDDVLKRMEETCNYIGLGPFRFTTTKEKLSPVLGLPGYKKIMDALAARPNHIPVYAIGGVMLQDVGPLIRTGVNGVAVSGIITHHPNKKLLIEQFKTILYEPVDHRE